MSQVNKDIRGIAGLFEAAFTKDFMQNRYLPVTRKFIVAYKAFLEKQGVEPGLLNFYITAKTFNKGQLSLCVAIPFGNRDIYEAFLGSLSDDMRKVWEYLLWEDFTDELLLEKRTGVKVYRMDQIRTYYNAIEEKKTILSDYEMFNLSASSYSFYKDLASRPKFMLGLPPFLRQLLVRYYPQPENAKLTPVAAPSKTQYVYDSGERNIAVEWPRVAAYKDQGQIAYTGKNRPSQTTLPKMNKNLSIKEFFPDAEEKKAKTLRTSLLAGMAAYLKKNSSSASVADDILRLFRSTYTDKVYSVPLVLPDLKGMGYVDEYDLIKKESEIMKIFAALPSGGWVPFENISNFVSFQLLDLRVMSLYTADNKLYYEYQDEDNWDNKHYISKGQYRVAVALPFLRGSFFLMAAFGLCDIAYDRPDWNKMGRDCFSSWDGLRYVRRTSLGDYICGLTKQYDASGIKSETKITLSPDTLLILTEEKDSSAASILEPYTERLGANRFRTDSRLFLNNIRSKKELEAKIILFKQIIGDELPPNWRAFFADLLHKINPFEPIEDAKVLQIPPENKDLARLVAQDPVLRSLVIKAEGFTIIVPKGNYAAMKRRLQEFGYLLTT